NGGKRRASERAREGESEGARDRARKLVDTRCVCGSRDRDGMGGTAEVYARAHGLSICGVKHLHV
ncbi:hypothetical protein BaRGS_00028967, partial [Batillaria attramentaria]